MPQQLEQFWRAKLEQASMRYKTATADYRTMLEKQSEAAAREPEGSDTGGTAGEALALIRARQAESQALAEYTHTLQKFTEVTMRQAREEPAGERFIAIVDDDESVREATKTLLRSAGYRVRSFISADELL